MARPDVSEARKAQILAAAERVFARAGLEIARMEEIAQEAGLSVGGVYWYFKGKDAVVQALVTAMFDAELSGVRAMLAQDGSAGERLASYMRANLVQTAAQSPLRNELYSLATRNDAARGHLRTYLAKLQRLLAQLVQQGIDRGEFRPVDPLQAALLCMATYEGFAELAMLGVAEADAGTELQAMVDLIVAGLAVAPAALPAPALPAAAKWQPPRGKWQG